VASLTAASRCPGGKGVFESLLFRWKAGLDTALRSFLCAAIAAAAGGLSLLFFGTAIFILLQQTYGTVTTCLAFGVFLLVAAAAALTVMSVQRRKAAERRRASAQAHPWWLDPRVVAAGLEFGKTVGGRRALSLGLVGAFLIGLLLSRGTDKK
jgi:hypothetical protein